VTTIFDEIREIPKFQRDFKKLSKKRFISLLDDIDTFINTQLKLFHKLDIDIGGVVRISDLGIDYPIIYKVTKFACKSIKGKGVRSGIQIIYAYYEKENIIEFIEIYHKSDKPNEDKQRIIDHYKLDVRS
jgi:hypothetical protein